MSVNKINPVYQGQTKADGDTLTANEWNELTNAVKAAQNKVNEVIDNPSTEVGGGSSNSETVTPIDTSGVLSVSGKGNVTLGSSKNINLEPAYGATPEGYNGNWGDIALKPGDDIQFCSHHRAPKKRDKIVIKIIDGSDNPVKMQMVAGEIEFAVGTKNNPKTATFKKDKTTGADTEDKLFKNSDAKVMDFKILTGNVLDEGTDNERDERAYLKVRAQAIDLRCEKHGGIALQPKGYDSDGNMNKIKFEHGGGDGLEFGTFNTEKSSLFTDEYRFNKNGVWKMATRQTTASDKDIIDEGTIPEGKVATGSVKYIKQDDDFYDVISQDDAQATTEQIIKSAAALNGGLIETKQSSKGNLSIAASSTYKIVALSTTVEGTIKIFDIPSSLANKTSYTKDDLKLILSGSTKLSDYIKTNTPFRIDSEDTTQYVLVGDVTPKVSLEAEEEVDIDAKYGDVVLTSGDTIKCEAPEIRLNAINADKTGGVVNFGATQDVLFITKKLTNGGKVEAPANPTKIKQVLQNNTSQEVLWNGSKFILILKELYGKDGNNELVKITPANYSTYKETNAYFSDGSAVPADYTCYCGFTTEDGGYYTTTVYAMGTKGSSPVFKKNLGNPVAIYSHNQGAVLGTTRTVAANSEDTSYTYIKGLEYIEFIFAAEEDTQSSAPGVTTVQPDSFVETSALTVALEDIFTLVDYFKNGAGQSDGPWASQL